MFAPHRSQTNTSELHQPVLQIQESFTIAPPTLYSSVSPVDESLHDDSPSRLPSWRSDAGVLVRQKEDGPTRPVWLRNPCTYTPMTDQDDISLGTRLNLVFADYFDNEQVPALAEVVGACGYSSVVQMCNDARRKGPQRMRLITRALLAMTAYYERMAAEGNRVALTILERIPQFDDLEAPEQTTTRAFAPQPQEHIVHLTGMDRKEDRGRELSPLDAYNQIIQQPSFEDISNNIQLEENEEGVFAIPLPNVEPNAEPNQ